MSNKIYSLIPKVMAEIKPIPKSERNVDQKYQFRSIYQLYSEIQPVLVKHGVFCVPQVQNRETSEIDRGEGKIAFRVLLTVAHKFYADDGSFIEVITVGEGIDRSDKASNKAMSAAMKYAFIELLSIPTEDVEDSDRTSPKAGKTKHTITKVTQVGGDFL